MVRRATEVMAMATVGGNGATRRPRVAPGLPSRWFLPPLPEDPPRVNEIGSEKSENATAITDPGSPKASLAATLPTLPPGTTATIQGATWTCMKIPVRKIGGEAGAATTTKNRPTHEGSARLVEKEEKRVSGKALFRTRALGRRARSERVARKREARGLNQ